MQETNLKMLIFHRTFAHLKTVHTHRKLVRQNCFACGLYKQGLLHDLSKYGLSELLPSTHYFQGYRSPYVKEKKVKGYSLGWLHHKGHNKHHWEYWWDIIGGNWKPIMMPEEYVVESLCDRIAACKVYQKDQYKNSSAYEYFQMSNDGRYMHPCTATLMTRLLESIRDYGEAFTFKQIKNLRKQNISLYEYYHANENDS